MSPKEKIPSSVEFPDVVHLFGNFHKACSALAHVQSICMNQLTAKMEGLKVLFSP